MIYQRLFISICVGKYILHIHIHTCSKVWNVIFKQISSIITFLDSNTTPNYHVMSYQNLNRTQRVPIVKK